MSVEIGGDVRRCRECGCTEDRACVTDRGPCRWVAPDLCSACQSRRGESWRPDVPAEPQRCAPTVSQIATLVFTIDQEHGLDTGELDKLTRDIASLFAAQPTVAQVKGEAIREFVQKVKAGLAEEYERDGEPYSTAVIDRLAGGEQHG